MRYCRKPYFIDAVQWNKLGDHPDVRQSGSIGLQHCSLCRKALLDHGLLGHSLTLVCPGNWIVTHPNGSRQVVSSTELRTTYDHVEGSS